MNIGTIFMTPLAFRWSKTSWGNLHIVKKKLKSKRIIRLSNRRPWRGLTLITLKVRVPRTIGADEDYYFINKTNWKWNWNIRILPIENSTKVKKTISPWIGIERSLFNNFMIDTCVAWDESSKSRLSLKHKY